MGKVILGLLVVVVGALGSLAAVGCSASEVTEQKQTPTGSNKDAEQELTLTGPDVIQIGWEHEPPLRNSSRRIIEGQEVDGDCRWASGLLQTPKIVRVLAVDLENCLELIEEGTLSAEGRKFHAAQQATEEAFIEKHPEYYGSGSVDAEDANQTPWPDVERSK